LLRSPAQYLAVYDLTKGDEDLLKELYENLIDRETKHDLGEVYTPDWLVELTLREADFGTVRDCLTRPVAQVHFFLPPYGYSGNKVSKAQHLLMRLCKMLSALIAVLLLRVTAA